MGQFQRRVMEGMRWVILGEALLLFWLAWGCLERELWECAGWTAGAGVAGLVIFRCSRRVCRHGERVQIAWCGDGTPWVVWDSHGVHHCWTETAKQQCRECGAVVLERVNRGRFQSWEESAADDRARREAEDDFE